jgi:hypothetical protein
MGHFSKKFDRIQRESKSVGWVADEIALRSPQRAFHQAEVRNPTAATMYYLSSVLYLIIPIYLVDLKLGGIYH